MMQRESGSPSSRVWLLGDSEPKNWSKELDWPLDPRHPARHNIWTPLLDVAQRHLYVLDKLRFDDSSLYVRNAISTAEHKPSDDKAVWPKEVGSELRQFAALAAQWKPMLIFSFGSFAHEFAGRALGSVQERRFDHWTATTLGERFHEACEAFDPQRTNLIPLLHISISYGRFLASHRDFCKNAKANYFEVVGPQIANLLLSGKDLGVKFLPSVSRSVES